MISTEEILRKIAELQALLPPPATEVEVLLEEIKLIFLCAQWVKMILESLKRNKEIKFCYKSRLQNKNNAIVLILSMFVKSCHRMQKDSIFSFPLLFFFK